IGQLDRPVSTQLQLHEQALLTSVEPKTYKEALTQSCWIEAMQEELHEFERLENKARLVARGYRQEEGIDFEESFASSRSVPAGFTKSVPAKVTRSVPAGFTRLVPAGFIRSVPAEVTRLVPAGFTRSVPAEITRSVPA
nr:integrase, catalytic region, zinc finger, CCHC-type, peptidase aspartic, catalytic [Tanacetum cinerariifolium]